MTTSASNTYAVDRSVGAFNGFNIVNESIVEAGAINALRNRAERGETLSEDEQAQLDAHEEAIGEPQKPLTFNRSNLRRIKKRMGILGGGKARKALGRVYQRSVQSHHRAAMELLPVAAEEGNDQAVKNLKKVLRGPARGFGS
jgi:hypothetical protein